MHTYIIKGTYRKNSDGNTTPFEEKIKAWGTDEAKTGICNVLSATHKDINVESCEYGGYDSDVIYFDTSTINNTKELKEAVSESKARHFFSPDTMRFFNSRLQSYILKHSEGVIFITSEKYDYDDPRLYTVRMFTNEGRIKSLSDFQELETLAQAKKFAREY